MLAIRRFASATLGLATTVALLAPAGPAAAAKCRYNYDSDGFPNWSTACSAKVAPGRFGPLRMGTTKVKTAKAKGYLAYNRFCSRWDGYLAYSDWRSKGGKISAWQGGSVTTKGLAVGATLEQARQVYPALVQTGFMANAYVDGEGWDIYSVGSKDGWLDLYRYNTPTEGGKYSFFAVRSRSVKKPETGWSQDGC